MTPLPHCLSAVELYTAEALACHDFLDTADVPRVVFGERLTVAERVEMACDDLRAYIHGQE